MSEQPIDTSPEELTHNPQILEDLGGLAVLEGSPQQEALGAEDDFSWLDVSADPASAGPMNPKKINWGSEQHTGLNNTDEAKLYLGAGVKVAGESLLTYIDQLRENSYVDDTQERVSKELAKEREFLLDALEEESCVNGVACEDNAAIILGDAELARLDLPEGEDDVERAKQLVTSLSESEIERFVRSHVPAETARIQQQEQALEGWKGIFLELTQQAIDKGALPPSIDTKAIEARLKALKVRVVDGLSARSAAAYNDRTHVLILASTQNPEQAYLLESPEGQTSRVSLFHAFGHEASHAVGAKVVVHKEGRDEGEHVVRSGLGFMSHTPGQDGESTMRFLALEEAVTELATMRIQNLETSDGRVAERKFLELLRTKGRQEISEDLFLEAKFEEYDASRPASERGAAWRQLRRSINEAYDPKFLVELDDMMEAYAAYDYGDSVQRAIDYLESDEKMPLGAMRLQRAAQSGLEFSPSWKNIVRKEKADEALRISGGMI
ncbi:MAG: hypothetical protein JWL89_12 [Candidatus Saccharibacteria bacterium]|nr:hypothetical protein [Candidatus Saccharibacteria bacterium]